MSLRVHHRPNGLEEGRRRGWKEGRGKDPTDSTPPAAGGKSTAITAIRASTDGGGCYQTDVLTVGRCLGRDERGSQGDEGERERDDEKEDLRSSTSSDVSDQDGWVIWAGHVRKVAPYNTIHRTMMATEEG